MHSRGWSSSLAALLCLSWLAVAVGYGASSVAVADDIDLGGQALSDGTSTDPGAPATVGPGLWRATLDGALPQYFSYQRRMNGSTVWIGVQGAPQGSSNDGIRVAGSVSGPDDAEVGCGEDNDNSEFTVPHALLGALVVVGDESGTTGESCRAAGDVLIKVDRGVGSGSGELPFVIKVVEEAPTSTTLGEGDEVDYTVPEPGEVAEVPGGTSFDAAPTLDARSEKLTIEATITEGAELLWRLPLSWGDVPVVRVDVGEPEGEVAEKFTYSGPDLSLHLIDPLRERYREQQSGDSSTGEYRVREGEGVVLVAAGLPVGRENAHLPGDNWIALAAEPAKDREPVEIPVEITVEVTATSDTRPTYDKAVLSHGREEGIDDYSPARPFLVGEGNFAAVASGSAVADGWWSLRHGAGLVIGALSAVCLAGGVSRLRARR